jgi:hypothetical protein
MRQRIAFGWGIPRVDQTAAADPVEISDIVATINLPLQECVGVAVVVRCCMATNFVVDVADRG